MLGSALTYAIYLIGNGQLVARVGAVRLTAQAMLWSAAAIFVQFLLTRPLSALVLPWPVYGYAIAMALFCTVLPTFMTTLAIRRIGSARNIKQITRAMQFVAASKLRRAQETTLASRPYRETLDEVIADLAAVLSGVDHPLLADRSLTEAHSRLIILITFLGIARRMPNVNILLAMVLAIGILSIAGSSRVIRAQVLTIKNQPYVEAARCMGAGNVRIIWNCVVPNVFPLMLVSMTVALGGVILAEASLSFLGFGPAGEPSWGQMLSVDGREYMRVQPGLAIWPGVCIALAVFGFNVFGDALRDTLDPRLRGSR